MNLNEFCRTCLSSGRTMFPLFGMKMIRKDSATVSVVNVLKLFTDISIYPDDSFPKKICTRCLEVLNFAYGFTLKCRSSEKILEPLIQGNITYNRNEICRACLHDDVPMFSVLDFLFHKNESIYETIPIHKILKLFLKIRPTPEDDKAPDKICTSCLEEVKCALAFKLKCEGSEKILKKSFRHFAMPFNNNNSKKSVANNEFDSVKEEIFDDNNITIENSKFPFGDVDTEMNMSQLIAFESIVIKKEYEMEVIDDVNTTNLQRTDNILECGNEELDNLTIDESEPLSEMLLNSENENINEDINKPAKLQCNKVKIEPTAIEYTDDCIQHAIKCPNCYVLIPSIDLLVSHMNDNHTSGQTCMLCHEEKVNWPDHISVHICDICFKTFDNKSAVPKHKKIRHKMNKNKCKICGRNCRSQDNLARHMKRNHPLRPYKCSSCLYSTIDENRLVNHLKKNHSNISHFSCEDCSSKFDKLDELRKHQNEHSAKYLCDKCFLNFESRNHLIEHKRIHSSNVVLINCEICNEEFNSELNIRAHMKIHIMENMKVASNYKCDACSQIFWVEAVANEHKKTHIVLRPPTSVPFKCKFCSSAFKRKRFLIRHMKKHRDPKNGIDENSNNKKKIKKNV